MPVVVPPHKDTEKHTRPMSETVSSEIAKISGLIELDVVYQYAFFRLKAEFPGVLDAVSTKQDFKNSAARLLIDNVKTDIELARVLVGPDVSPNQLKSAGLYVMKAYDKVEKIMQIAEEVEHEAKKQKILFDCGFLRHPEKSTVSFMILANSRILSIVSRIKEVWNKEKELHPNLQELIFPSKLRNWEENPDFSELNEKAKLVEIKAFYPESLAKSIAEQDSIFSDQGLLKPTEAQLAMAFLLNFLATGKDLFEGAEVRAKDVTLKFSDNTGLANSFYIGQPHSGNMGVAILIKEQILD